MTEEQYLKKYKEYSQKLSHYREKLLKLETDYWEQMNKDNKFLKRLKGEQG